MGLEDLVVVTEERERKWPNEERLAGFGAEVFSEVDASDVKDVQGDTRIKLEREITKV